MTAITGSRSSMQIEENQYKSSVSEALMQKIGANINYIHSKDDAQDGRLTDLEVDVASILSSVAISTFAIDNPSITVPANTFYFVNLVPAPAGSVTFNFPHTALDYTIENTTLFTTVIAGPSTVITSSNGSIYGYLLTLV